MKLTDYIKEAGATDHETYDVVADRMADDLNLRLMHYSMGLCTEAAEVQDMLKKVFIYGKDFDPVNLKEELGDIMWYMARICAACGWEFEELAQLNIDKLKLRYGDKFTKHAALNRDLKTERELLEKGGK